MFNEKLFRSKRMFRFRFHVENTKSNKTQCEICLSYFNKGEIRIVHSKIKTIPDYFHLNCYNPKFKQFISMQDIGLDLDKKSTTIFNNWLNAWNANYFPLDQHQFSPSLPSQQNLEVQVKNRRSFLEVFKFLEVSEIVLSLSKVNKNFYSLTWEKELWNFLLVRDFSIVKQDLEVDELKEAYVTCFYDFCIECKKKPSNEKFNRCPLLKKTLCRDCLMMKKFHTFDKTDIWRIYGIKSDLVKVAWWTSDGINRITYRVLFESGLMMFRKEQKQKVLDFLKNFCTNSHVIQSFENLDVTLMDLKVKDEKFLNLELFVSNYQMDIKGGLFEKMFEFIRKGKKLDLYKFIRSKQLKG